MVPADEISDDYLQKLQSYLEIVILGNDSVIPSGVEEKLKDIRATLAMLTKQSNKVAKKMEVKSESEQQTVSEPASDSSSISPNE